MDFILMGKFIFIEIFWKISYKKDFDEDNRGGARNDRPRYNNNGNGGFNRKFNRSWGEIIILKIINSYEINHSFLFKDKEIGLVICVFN